MVKLDILIIKQAIVYEYKHTNSQNDQWMVRLKAIEAEYYSIENSKSYMNMSIQIVNDQWMVRLEAIEAEYYSIEN